jgi:hypothetical protein
MNIFDTNLQANEQFQDLARFKCEEANGKFNGHLQKASFAERACGGLDVTQMYTNFT